MKINLNGEYAYSTTNYAQLLLITLNIYAEQLYTKHKLCLQI